MTISRLFQSASPRMGALAWVAFAILVAPAPSAASPTWTDSMRVVNAVFSGNEFYAGKAGSTTYTSVNFWAPFSGQNLDLGGNPWTEEVAALNGAVFLPSHASPATVVGRSTSWVLNGSPSPLDQLLAEQPEVTMIMFGSSDVSGTDGSGFIWTPFESNLIAIVEQVLAANSIPVLTTIHPQRDRVALIDSINVLIGNVADSFHVPLNDFHQAVLDQRPTDWDGTLIAADGTNLSNGGTGPGDLSTSNLDDNGYALLNHTTMATFSQIHDLVLTYTVGVEPATERDGLSLAPVRPTPVTGVATLAFTTPRDGHVRLTLHDALGRTMATIADEWLPAGPHVVPWSGRGHAGTRFAAGMYFLRLQSSGRSIHRAIPIMH